ncbi:MULTISPECIES: hypothetical protein [Mycobacterium avium complex (MAC)]|nr:MULTISPECIES: hypothetical protein [Mycobacterium avium complex (MAC)]MCF1814684.1 hypothetical protein [Mycobacterium intracellulare subsp. intracellulare]MDM3928163.1 hypothetical protein [Mycobacterium intracellulare subsp. chimaera]MDS0336538.1 hypothetical protein [Mycobacterium intracellulare]BCO85914.1 hypothetical protein MINTM011_42490 [Mycobacterium paraintracellulare]
MSGEHAIVFVIHDRTSNVAGYTSLIEWSTTSYYVKSTYKPMQSMKVSVHCPDPKHIGKQHFRFDFDHADPARKAVAAGGAWVAKDGLQLPLYFPGRPVNKRTLHIVRFSAEWDMFVKGVPSAPKPSPKQKATLHARLEAPSQSQVAHVDIFLSNVRPYWGNERKVRDRDAGMGPIINSTGQYLTAIIYHRHVTEHPDPFGDVRQGAPLDQCIRGIASKVDPAGFLWMCEKMIPRSEFSSFSPSLQPPPPGGAPPPANGTTAT